MEKWYNLSIEDTEKKLEADSKNGLSDDEVRKRREKYGLNELKEKKPKTLFQKFLDQFKDFMIIILIIAAIISAIVGVSEGEGITDTIIIMVVIVVNAIIGVVQENKAEKSLEALKKMSTHSAKTVRNGSLIVIPSRELVPGDLVVLEAGDYVPADLRLIESASLKIQESALTGESVPVEKETRKVKEDASLGDRTNMAFSSSLVTYGRGKGIVTDTGMETEVGKIAEMINEAEETVTPLQRKLNNLGKTLGVAVIIICVVMFVIGIIYGKEPIHMLMSAVSLAVAAIPEGLAAVSTIVLAIGVQRMVKRNAIVKKLPAVETLGSASVICSDKTGTLTQNKMTVKNVFANGITLKVEDIEKIDKETELVIRGGMLCNDTKESENGELQGDPTETALVKLGYDLNFSKTIYDEAKRVYEIPFDSDRKLMTTVNKEGEKYVVYCKGAIDELLKRCSAYSKDGEVISGIENYSKIIDENNLAMAKQALRVLAFAYKIFDHEPQGEELTNLESDLIFVGMVGMIDPPRPEAKEAVEKCISAGIKPVMITGDHKVTAAAIATELGILGEGDEVITGAELQEISDEELVERVRHIAVYARVSPEHKVRIVKAWQANGEIVAMTGDGVNDAPALKTADIGCSMGITGTDVAKEASDVILTDDNFATVVASVEEGRRIYDNILKAITFLLSSNIGEIVVLFIAVLISPWLSQKFGINNTNLEPLLAIHILWINLVTDSLPALALAVDPASKDIMSRKPNKNTKGIFTKGITFRIIYQGIMIGLLTLAAFIIGLSIDGDENYKIQVAQTMSFTVLAFSELVHVFNIRDHKKSAFTNMFNNRVLLLAVLVSASLMFAVLFIPFLRNIFGLVTLPIVQLEETIALIIAPLIIVEIIKLLKLNGTKNEN